MDLEMPCVCQCGNVFDLPDGNPCDGCGVAFCTECVSEPWGYCPDCNFENGNKREGEHD